MEQVNELVNLSRVFEIESKTKALETFIQDQKWDVSLMAQIWIEINMLMAATKCKHLAAQISTIQVDKYDEQCFKHRLALMYLLPFKKQ
jgi:hypothetical protein